MSADSTSAQASRPASIPTWGWWTISLILLLSFVQFWVSTMPVRFACSDDTSSQAAIDERLSDSQLIEYARDQGRFFFATPVFQQAARAPYALHRPWLFSLCRTTALFLQISLAAILAARLLGNATCGAWLALFLTATLHLPLTFYPILSFPNLWIGGSAVLGALLCQHAHVHNPKFWTGCLASALYLTACLMQDYFVVFLPAFVALSLLGPHRKLSGLARINTGPLVVAAAYAIVYAGFVRLHPSIYDGTRLSTNVVTAAKVLFRQMMGIAPGFELLVNRPPPGTTGPLFRSAGEIRATLAQTPLLGLVLGCLQAISLTWVSARSLHHPAPAARHWPWLVALAILLNAPIAFSVKYQTFIFHREYPYVYAFYSSVCLGFAFIGLWIWSGRWSDSPGRRLSLVGLHGCVMLTLCISAQASNHRVLEILLKSFN
jgi:hypothetical protein